MNSIMEGRFAEIETVRFWRQGRQPVRGPSLHTQIQTVLGDGIKLSFLFSAKVAKLPDLCDVMVYLISCWSAETLIKSKLFEFGK